MKWLAAVLLFVLALAAHAEAGQLPRGEFMAFRLRPFRPSHAVRAQRTEPPKVIFKIGQFEPSHGVRVSRR